MNFSLEYRITNPLVKYLSIILSEPFFSRYLAHADSFTHADFSTKDPHETNHTAWIWI